MSDTDALQIAIASRAIGRWVVVLVQALDGVAEGAAGRRRETVDVERPDIFALLQRPDLDSLVLLDDELRVTRTCLLVCHPSRLRLFVTALDPAQSPWAH